MIFVYSDESGVFDKEHNNYFVFGGLIFFSKDEKDSCIRRYKKAEADVRNALSYEKNKELKASILPPKYKSKLYRSLNNDIKFGIIVKQELLKDEIFNDKKTKQRYQDFAYKIGLKAALCNLLKEGKLVQSSVDTIYVFVDEHSMATNGKYELREALEQEFKIGTFNYNYDCYFPPVFPGMSVVDLKLCDSKDVVLVRASDIIANHLYYKVTRHDNFRDGNLYIKVLPN